MPQSKQILPFFFRKKGIKVVKYKPEVLGLGGGGIGTLIEWFINFYHAHKTLLIFLVNHPEIRRKIKDYLYIFRDWVYRQKFPEEKKPTLHITFLLTVDFGFEDSGEGQQYGKLEHIKVSIIEICNLFPEVISYLSSKHGEFEFIFNVKSRHVGKSPIVSINNYSREKIALARIVKDIQSLEIGHKTFVYSIYRKPLLRYPTYKLIFDSTVYY